MALLDGQQDSEDELDRRTNEFLRFVVGKGLVDLFVGEDGKFEFSPTLGRLCPHPECQRQCAWAIGLP